MFGNSNTYFWKLYLVHYRLERLFHYLTHHRRHARHDGNHHEYLCVPRLFQILLLKCELPLCAHDDVHVLLQWPILRKFFFNIQVCNNGIKSNNHTPTSVGIIPMVWYLHILHHYFDRIDINMYLFVSKLVQLSNWLGWQLYQYGSILTQYWCNICKWCIIAPFTYITIDILLFHHNRLRFLKSTLYYCATTRDPNEIQSTAKSNSKCGTIQYECTTRNFATNLQDSTEVILWRRTKNMADQFNGSIRQQWIKLSNMR